MTGRAALEKAVSGVPDLVLLDLMLPEMDGLEVCRLLKSDSETASIPVIMLTAKGTEADIVAGLATPYFENIVGTEQFDKMQAGLSATRRKNIHNPFQPLRGFANFIHCQQWSEAVRTIRFDTIRDKVHQLILDLVIVRFDPARHPALDFVAVHPEPFSQKVARPAVAALCDFNTSGLVRLFCQPRNKNRFIRLMSW